jgi:hypothetical protein
MGGGLCIWRYDGGIPWFDWRGFVQINEGEGITTLECVLEM